MNHPTVIFVRERLSTCLILALLAFFALFLAFPPPPGELQVSLVLVMSIAGTFGIAALAADLKPWRQLHASQEMALLVSDVGLALVTLWILIRLYGWSSEPLLIFYATGGLWILFIVCRVAMTIRRLKHIRLEER